MHTRKASQLKKNPSYILNLVTQIWAGMYKECEGNFFTLPGSQ